MQTFMIGDTSPVQAPFTLIASGVSGVGKSHFIRKVITTPGVINPPPNRVIYHYGSEFQDELFGSYPDWVEFRRGFDGILEAQSLHVFDDLLGEMEEHSQVLQNAFTRDCHHSGISIIYIVQNIFPKNEKGFRIMSLNVNYITLFKQPRDERQIMTVATQVRPGDTHFFMLAYEDAVSEAFGYLYLDFKAGTPKQLQISTQIFPGQQRHYYIPDPSSAQKRKKR